MSAAIKTTIEEAFAKSIGLRGTAVERDDHWWVEVAIEDCGPDARYHRTWEAEPLEGVDFLFTEI